MLHLLYSLPSFEDSAQNRNRTSDTRIFSPLLSQRSYLGICDFYFRKNLSSGDRIWTYDLRVMSPTSFQTAPPRDIHIYIICGLWVIIPHLAPKCNGWRWIRTTEAICSRFTVCPLWPLGNPSIKYYIDKSQKPMIGLEPITCWLQISCSANWATSALYYEITHYTVKMGPIGLEPMTLCL